MKAGTSPSFFQKNLEGSTTTPSGAPQKAIFQFLGEGKKTHLRLIQNVLAFYLKRTCALGQTHLRFSEEK
ncbi:hypothetical protein [uncultured Bacteroides sp.]|uniref:hypothetical protein n=1 Tax=uncultured Bacteroides sp. TaxID=162156 RepID=UPI00258D9A51|nr:hypothetical protein [uncultured Bacteroides sp.]